ncbi:helix-turn-helix transcriptional regulator [Aurantivibrio plasticivorans]
MSRPTVRVLALLELLQSHGRLSGAEIAQRLAVDRRTVRRYITTLEDLGIPITTEQGRYGGYMLVAGFKLPPMMFTNEEAQAITLGLIAAAQLGLEEGTPAIASVQSKLERVMPVNLKQRVRALGESINIVLPHAETLGNGVVLSRLTNAAQYRESVELLYQSKQGDSTQRIIDPYGLVYRFHRWYVCGFCHLRQELRTFRIDRILNVTLLEQSFERPLAFDAAEFLNHSIMQAPRVHSISLLFHTDLATASNSMCEVEALLEQRTDGILLRTTTDSYDWLASWLVSLPFDFTIVEPTELKQALRQRLATLERSTR